MTFPISGLYAKMAGKEKTMRKRQQRRLIILICILSAIVVLIAGSLVYYIVFQEDTTGAVAVTSPAQTGRKDGTVRYAKNGTAKAEADGNMPRDEAAESAVPEVHSVINSPEMAEPEADLSAQSLDEPGEDNTAPTDSTTASADVPAAPTHSTTSSADGPVSPTDSAAAPTDSAAPVTETPAEVFDPRAELARSHTDDAFWEGCPPRNIQLLTPNPYSRPQQALDTVNTLVIHYVGNAGSSAMDNRNYFESLKDSQARSASSHFVIGLDGEIVQCIPLSEMAYATKNRNPDTISIECCHPGEDGQFNEYTYWSLVELSAWLCLKFHLDPQGILRHYDVTQKLCPLYYVEHPDEWQKLKDTIEVRLSELKAEEAEAAATVTEPTPSAESAASSAEPAVPSAESAASSAEPAAPSAESAASAAESAASAAESAAPSAESAASSAEPAAPSAEPAAEAAYAS